MSKKLTPDEAADLIRHSIVQIIRSAQNRTEASAFIFQLGYELLRGTESHEFMSEFLNVLIHDFEKNSPKITIRELN